MPKHPSPTDLQLLDAAHKTDQNRLANPDFEMLRSIFRIAVERKSGPLSCTELVRLAVETGHLETDGQENILKMGRILSKQFPQPGETKFSIEFRVLRTDLPDANYEKAKKYQVIPMN